MIMSPPPPIDSPIAMKASPSLEVPNPSLAQLAMEPHNNIPTLPYTKILYLVPIDVPTPIPTKVSKPLHAKVLVPPSIQALTPSIHKVSTPSSTEVPPISTIMNVCIKAKESSKTLLQKSYKSIKQVKNDVKQQQLYVSL
jgi:hypothetical protein